MSREGARRTHGPPAKSNPAHVLSCGKTRVDVTELGEVQGGPIPGVEEILAQAQGTGSSRHSTT